MDTPAPASPSQAVLIGLINAVGGCKDPEALAAFLGFAQQFSKANPEHLPETARLLQDAVAVLLDDLNHWQKVAQYER